MMKPESTQDRRLGLKLVFMAVAMFGFGFLLVPLYDVFCELTGTGGRMDTVAAQLTGQEIPQDRQITVEFVASVNQQAPWEFRPIEAQDGVLLLHRTVI